MIAETPDRSEEPDARDIPRIPESNRFDELGYDRAQRCLYEELTNVLNRFSREFELTPINIVAVLESLKHDVFTRALEDEDNDS